MSKMKVWPEAKNGFQSLVEEALNKANVRISLSAKNYLSELLQFYVFSDHLFSKKPSGKNTLKTLAELYLEAFHSSYLVQRNLKKMGDTSLYITGFFREHLRRKLVSVDYYIDMGKTAYNSLSDLHEDSVFKELAVSFSDLTHVLFQIQKGKDVSSLLNHYITTGSEATAQDLARKGVFLSYETNKKDYSH